MPLAVGHGDRPAPAHGRGVDFHCDELEISTIPPGERGRKTAREDFDRARAALVALSKSAFPEDKEIQGLNDERSGKRGPSR